MECPVSGGTVGASSSALSAAMHFFTATQCLIAEQWPPHASVTNGSSYDLVVVGGGSAGSALAARLSGLGRSVLLVEAGPHPPVESIIPGYRDTLKGSEYDWNYATENDGVSSQALSGGRQWAPRGRMLSGSGGINDMVYTRGVPEEYEWGELWSWEEVLPHFIALENMTDERIVHDPGLMQLHGTQGPIEVSGYNSTSYGSQTLLQCFAELGFDVKEDITRAHAASVGRLSRTVKAGRRVNSAIALLNNAAVKDPNLHVLYNTLVTKVLIENDTAYGVVALIDNEEYHFYATKEVILSAGAYNTPQLLMLSGIGPKQHLKDHGIPLVKDLPVGENLHDHVMVLTFVAVDPGLCITNQDDQHMDVIKYLYDRSGSLSFPETVAAYLSFPDERFYRGPTEANFAFYPTCVPVNGLTYSGCTEFGPAPYCEELISVNQYSELISLAIVLHNPKSRGRVRLNSTNPRDYPLIFSATFSDEDDLKWFPQAFEVAYSLANTSYFVDKNARVVPLELDICSGESDDDYARCVARGVVQLAWHAGGTSAMGPVLDPRLSVLGVHSLRVVDAGVMPRPVRASTDATIVMIADRVAQFILEDLDCDTQ